MHGGNRPIRRKQHGLFPFFAALAFALTAFPNVAPVEPTQHLILRTEPDSLEAVRSTVRSIGGTVYLDLSIIDGFAAEIPAEVDASSLPGVLSVTPDATIQLASTRPGTGYVSMSTLTDRVLDVDRLWAGGITGDGVGVALIDTGITPVTGLDTADKVVNGPDLSFDGDNEDLRYLDLYGHGTHLASIIAGEDPRFDPRRTRSSVFAGVAPEATIVNVKVADGMGAADVSQVIAGIQWVIDHKDDGPVDIRVLALAFGTDSEQDYLLDPLAYAAEQAWHAGIVVVVAAGNDSADSPLRNPATDPYVIAVGALDTNKTARFWDDRTLPFSNCGTEDRPVDILAPGKSIGALRVPNSYIDAEYPGARLGRRYFRGTGSSQATAVVAGAAALLIDQRPDLTPDQVKALLVNAARSVRNAQGHCADAGSLDIRSAVDDRTPIADQTWSESTGGGSLEEARGSYHVSHDGVVLEGEIDVTGEDWTGAAGWDDTGDWNGVTWSGGSWNGGSWNGVTWSGVTWSGVTWSGVTWSGVTWSGVTWSGVTWSSVTWSGVTWSGVTWSGSTWSDAAWR